MKDHNTPNPNDARADRAFAALRYAGAGERDIETAVARMLTDLYHLCQRHGVTPHAATRRASDAYDSELAAEGPVAHRARELEPEPIAVVTLTGSGATHYRASVLAICGEFIDDSDDEGVLVELWNLLVATLTDGRASEDPENIPRRTFSVEETQRSVLASQLLELRAEAGEASAIDLNQLAEPDGGLAQFLN